jgi:hypothetical protein
MRARLGVSAMMLLLASSIAAGADGLPRELLGGLQLNSPITTTPPPLAVARLDGGRTLTLRELRGRPVLLYFWATW